MFHFTSENLDIVFMPIILAPNGQLGSIHALQYSLVLICNITTYKNPLSYVVAKASRFHDKPAAKVAFLSHIFPEMWARIGTLFTIHGDLGIRAITMCYY